MTKYDDFGKGAPTYIRLTPLDISFTASESMKVLGAFRIGEQ